MVIALLALFVALSGTAAGADVVSSAKKLITGAQIKNGSVGIADLSPSARKKLRGPTGPAGPKGAAGAAGGAGAAGTPGTNGTNGTNGTDGDDGTDATFNGVAANGDLDGTYPAPTIALGVLEPDRFKNTSFPAIRATRSGGNQVVNSQSLDFVHFNTQDFGRAVTHNVGTGDSQTCGNPDTTPGDCFLTVQQSGTYLVAGSVIWGINGAGLRQIFLTRWTVNLGSSKNIASDMRDVPVGNGLPAIQPVQTTSAVVQLTSGQSVSMRALHDAGTGLAVQTDDLTWLSLTWIGPGA
jgi:hypothetical protein